MPSTQLAQKQVSVMSRLTDVVQHCATPKLAGIIYNQIAKAEKSLGNTRGNGDVLDLTERNISRSPRHQSGVNFDLGVRQRIANHISSDVEIGWYQQEGQRKWDRDVSRDVDESQQKNQYNSADHRDCVTQLYENHSRPDSEDSVLKLLQFF